MTSKWKTVHALPKMGSQIDKNDPSMSLPILYNDHFLINVHFVKTQS